MAVLKPRPLYPQTLAAPWTDAALSVRQAPAYALSLMLAASLVTGVCYAQPISAPGGKATRADIAGVTVIAPPTPKIIEKQAQEFVQSYAAVANPNVDQIGRWHDPVCVMVMGLPLVEQAAKIKARIESMAQSLGLPAAAANCKPNVEIAFEDDPQNAMNSVAKSNYVQYLLGYYHLSKTDQIKMVHHPIQAWYVTQTRTDGVNVGGLIDSRISPDLYLYSPNIIDDPQNKGPAGCFRRETACENSAFYNVLIVADNKALHSKTLHAIADDMVMLALSQPKSLDGCYVLPSIIDRFADKPCVGRSAPDELTPADTAYLSALYSADLESRKNIEQTDIASRMATTLIKAHAEAGDKGDSAPSAAKAQ